jgi:hypothetical protein
MKTTTKKNAKADAPKAAKAAPKAVAKPAAKPAPAPKAAPAKKAVKKAAVQSTLPIAEAPAKKAVSPEERYQMIQVRAYYKALSHGFTGDSIQFWLEAEKEIDELFS